MKEASTAICSYDTSKIVVRDLDLCKDLIGQVSLSDFVYLLVMARRPSEAERTITEAAMIAIAEHGMTPSALAARLTYMGAPESLQGAVAAGLLGVGDQFVGTVEQVAPLLVEIVGADGDKRSSAKAIVQRLRDAKALVPGFGQPHHKPDDPRPPALFRVAEDVGVKGDYIAALRVLGEEVDAAVGRHMTINGPAAIAALFLEIDMPVAIMRGFVIIARCIGMVGHLAEEQINPAGRGIWEAAAHAVTYTGKPV